MLSAKDCFHLRQCDASSPPSTSTALHRRGTPAVNQRSPPKRTHLGTLLQRLQLPVHPRRVSGEAKNASQDRDTGESAGGPSQATIVPHRMPATAPVDASPGQPPFTAGSSRAGAVKQRGTSAANQRDIRIFVGVGGKAMRRYREPGSSFSVATRAMWSVTEFGFAPLIRLADPQLQRMFSLSKATRFGYRLLIMRVSLG